MIISIATKSATRDPPPIPIAGGIAVFPILNCNIRKAAVPINIAGIKILFFNLSLCASLNWAVTFSKLPICNCFVIVIKAKMISNPPVTLYGIIFPKINVIPRINQNKNVPILAFSFFNPLIAVATLTSPQRI